MSGSGAPGPDCPPTNEPVNLANGNLFVPVTDVQIPGRGLGLTLTRTYNSQVITPFPVGWDTGLGSWVVENGEASGEGGQNWHPREWGDFELSFKMKTTAQDPEGVNPDLEFYTGWVHFRFKDYDNHYQFLIKTTGVVELVKYYEEDGQVEREFWRKWTSVRSTNWNQVVIRAVGSRILIMVNGQVMFDIQDTEPLPAGRIGLEAHRSHVHWDNFTLTDLTTGQSHTHIFDDILNQEGMFGYGWTSNLEMRLEEVTLGSHHGSETAMMLTREDGRQDHFMHEPDGTYKSPVGIQDRLSKTANGYTLRRKDGLTWSFDAAGRLMSVVDRNGNRLMLTRDNQGRVTALTDPTGRRLTFAYGANAKVYQMTDPAGRRWSYSYDSAKHLVQVTDPLGLTERYDYDPTTHNMTSYTDKTGAVFRYAYTIDDRVKTQTDPEGKVTTFTWQVPFAGLGGSATTIVTNALGESWSYRFKLEDEVNPDVHDQIHVITDPFGNLEGFHWDANKNRDGRTDESGRSIFWEYDTLGNITKIIQFSPPVGSGNNSISRMTYEPVFSQVTSQTDPNSSQTFFEYDSKGNLTKVWKLLDFGEKAETALTYDSYGQLLTMTDPLGRRWTFTYDAHGNRTSATDSTGGVTRVAYDIVGRPVSVTDAGGRATVFSWDAGDRLTKVTDPLGGETLYSYDGNGNVLSVTNPEGETTRFEYDRVGNLTRKVDPLGNAVTYTWETADFMHFGTSRLMSMTEPSESRLFDPSLDVNADGSVSGSDALIIVNYLNDPSGSSMTPAQRQMADVNRDGIISASDALAIINALNYPPPAKTTQYQYDARGRLILVTDPLGRVTRYGYDATTHVTSITDASGKVTSYTYDDMERLTQVTDPLGNTTKFGYNRAGNPTVKIDANNVWTVHVFDSLNRVKQIYQRIPGNSAVDYTDFTYDKAGNWLSMRDSTGTTRYEYDALNRLIRTTTPDGRSVSSGYDRVGNRTSMTSPLGLTSYRYDALNRVTRMTDPFGGMYDFEYDRASRRTRLQSPNGVKALYQYDDAGRLSSLGYQTSASAALTEFSYAYDVTGNMVLAKRGPIGSAGSGTTRYSYDPLNQLTRALYPDGALDRFSYDPAGNRSNANGTAYTYDAANRLTQMGNVTFAYDPAGNLTSKTEPEIGITHYSYDKFNRLIGINADPGPSFTLLEGDVNGDGVVDLIDLNTVRSHFGQKTTEGDANGDGVVDLADLNAVKNDFGMDIGSRRYNALYTYNGDGVRMAKQVNGVVTKYLYDGLNLLAETTSTGTITQSYVQGPGIDEVLATRNHTTNQTIYHLADHLSSTVALVDSAQQIRGTFTYAAFGTTRTQTGSVDTNLRFTGREWDAESGLLHYRARAYDPTTGRFLQQDPFSRTPADPRVIQLNHLARLERIHRPFSGIGMASLGIVPVAIGTQVGLLRSPLDMNVYPYALNNPLIFVDPLGLARSRANQWRVGAMRYIGMQYGGQMGGVYGGRLGAWIGSALAGPAGAAAGYVIGQRLGQAYGASFGSGLGDASEAIDNLGNKEGKCGS